MRGSEPSILLSQIKQWGGKKGCFDLFGVVKPIKQIKTKMVDVRVLNYFKEIEIYEMLKLDKYFDQQKESVGASYDGVLFLPAHLSPELAWPKFEKYTHKKRNICEESWDLALEWTHQHFSAIGSYERCSPLRETILQDSDNLEGSCGFCWPRFEDKKDFIENHFEIYDKIKRQFYYSPVSPARAFIKEELREGAKVVEEPSSRMIWGLSVILFLAQYDIFANLMNSFLRERNKIWSSCGMNFSGAEYCSEISKFDLYSNLVCSVDGSSFDASMQVQDMIDLFYVWDSYYEGTRDEEYYNLLSFIISNEIFTCVVMPDGSVVFKETGNPSGSLVTLIRNTFHDFRLYAYVYIRACIKYGVKPKLIEYKRKHFGKINGDDIIISSSKFMNWALIQEFMSPFLKLTSISYEGRYEIPLTQATYCGVTPIEYKHQYVPVRNSYKLLLSLLFMNENEDLLEQRILGLAICNPFDGFFIDILFGLCDYLNLSRPLLGPIRDSYLLKHGKRKSHMVVAEKSTKNFISKCQIIKEKQVQLQSPICDLKLRKLKEK
jgi:hypothetical protein